MATQELRDKYNNIIARIITENETLKIYDKNHNFKGVYRPKDNTTYDRNGQYIGKGNLLLTLI